jgi:hypothetical protein
VKLKAEMDELAQRAAGTNEVVRSLGLTFSSAFESAISGGKSFRDILGSIEKDIIRIIARESITKPFLAALATKIGGKDAPSLDVGKLFGGDGAVGSALSSAGSWLSSLFGFAEGGYIPPGQWGMTGERGPEPVFGGNTGVTVVPNSGGAVNVTMHISTPDANSFRASQSQILARLTQSVASGRRNL